MTLVLSQFRTPLQINVKKWHGVPAPTGGYAHLCLYVLEKCRIYLYIERSQAIPVVNALFIVRILILEIFFQNNL